MKIDYTSRGFQIIRFQDCNDNPCTLQQSSVTNDLDSQPGSTAVWLGIGDQRMHLDVDQVEALIDHLGSWLETGSF